jgi:hypothetical protein
MWCEPVPDLTVPIEPTRAEAEAALLRLRTAFRTFPFSGSPMVTRGEIMVVDISKPPSSAESAFLAALQTACCRASLRLHRRAELSRRRYRVPAAARGCW